MKDLVYFYQLAIYRYCTYEIATPGVCGKLIYIENFIENDIFDNYENMLCEMS